MIGAFQLSDVFVLPAVPIVGDMEGFGIVLLEAEAAGLPVMATAVGGVMDAAEDGQTGVLVGPEAVDEMALHLVDFLTDEERRMKVADRGRQRAVRDFSWSSICARHLKAILQVESDPR